MSLATEFAPSYPVPARALVGSPGRPSTAFPATGPSTGPSPAPTSPRLASVTTLRAPSGPAAVAPLRLTHRGVLVLALVVALLGAALVWVAALSTPAGGAAGAPPGPVVVTVSPGDTLWSIATRAAPDRDPRAEVATLQRINHLDGVELVPGQRLRVR